jgi:hypothetical protein
MSCRGTKHAIIKTLLSPFRFKMEMEVLIVNMPVFNNSEKKLRANRAPGIQGSWVPSESDEVLTKF